MAWHDMGEEGGRCAPFQQSPNFAVDQNQPYHCTAYKFGVIETGYYVFEIFAINNPQEQLLLLTAACGNDPAAPKF